MSGQIYMNFLNLQILPRIFVTHLNFIFGEIEITLDVYLIRIASPFIRIQTDRKHFQKILVV